MDKHRLGFFFAIVSAALVLLTTYLAIFYAPLPQTGVRSADEILSSVEGSHIQVVGFVCAVETDAGNPRPQATLTIIFSIADMVDYHRFVTATVEGRLGEQWWTVRPIDAKLILEGHLGLLEGTSAVGGISLGANLSVHAKVVEENIGPNSAITGFSLSIPDSKSVSVDIGGGGFGTMSAPVAQKIFYFHMPSAWVSYLAFLVTLVSSALYLKSRDAKYDRWALSAAELGVLFATIAILTGPIWAKQEWGVYWRWSDTKLVTTFILWLVYIGYLMLRASVSDPGTRSRVSAVYGIVGFVTVPMSLLSARIAPLLRSSHPEVIASNTGGLSPEAGLTIGVALVAFTMLFITMLIKRVEIAESEEDLEELKRTIGGED
jgi:heme exporter protein C